MNDKPPTVHPVALKKLMASAMFAKQPEWRAGGIYDFDQFEVFAEAALEACHNAELVQGASKFVSVARRAGPTTDLYWAACERLEEVLAKIGGDA